MTRLQLVAELRAIEWVIAAANNRFQYAGGPRPSEAEPAACARRKELRRILVEHLYA